MTREKNSFHFLEFFIIYIGGNYVAGLLQAWLRTTFPALAETTAGRLLTGLWLQDVIILLLIFVFVRSHGASLGTIGVRRPQGRHAWTIAAIWGLALFFLMTVLIIFINAFWPGGLAEQNVQSYLVLSDALWVKLFVILTMGVFVPFVEELLFRGYLFTSLCNLVSPQTAMMITALLFGSGHFDIQRLIPLAIGGYLLNIIAYRSQSILTSAIAHGVWNIMMILQAYL